jgi:hypothetical protein
MKRIILSLAILATLLTSSVLLASEDKEHASQAMTIQGEIVDMGCYLNHASLGPKHKECATMCINGGMPMGLLTSDGKLYLLTMSHDDAAPFNACKKLAAEMVSITGPVSERNGVKSIDVTAVKQVKSETKTTK